MIIALPISWVLTGCCLSIVRSTVRVPFASTFEIAFSIELAASENPKVYLSIMALDKIWAMGLAIPFPAISGAEPHAGS